MGISMGPILILNIMAENDSNMIDLVLTHLTLGLASLYMGCRGSNDAQWMRYTK